MENWQHELNVTYEAVYTLQESSQVRAIIEDTVTVRNGATIIELPDHFSGPVNTDEDMTVQVTPYKVAMVAAIQRNITPITIVADRDVAMDYRVTGNSRWL